MTSCCWCYCRFLCGCCRQFFSVFVIYCLVITILFIVKLKTQLNSIPPPSHTHTHSHKQIYYEFFSILIATCYFSFSVLFKLFLSFALSLSLAGSLSCSLVCSVCTVLYHYLLSTIFVCLCVVRFFWVSVLFFHCYLVGCVCYCCAAVSSFRTDGRRSIELLSALYVSCTNTYRTI